VSPLASSRRAQSGDGSLQNQTAYPLCKEPSWPTIDLWDVAHERGAVRPAPVRLKANSNHLMLVRSHAGVLPMTCAVDRLEAPQPEQQRSTAWQFQPIPTPPRLQPPKRRGSLPTIESSPASSGWMLQPSAAMLLEILSHWYLHRVSLCPPGDRVGPAVHEPQCAVLRSDRLLKAKAGTRKSLLAHTCACS
jgi:hypothetical protein